MPHSVYLKLKFNEDIAKVVVGGLGFLIAVFEEVNLIFISVVTTFLIISAFYYIIEGFTVALQKRRIGNLLMSAAFILTGSSFFENSVRNEKPTFPINICMGITFCVFALLPGVEYCIDYHTFIHHCYMIGIFWLIFLKVLDSILFFKITSKTPDCPMFVLFLVLFLIFLLAFYLYMKFIFTVLKKCRKTTVNESFVHYVVPEIEIPSTTLEQPQEMNIVTTESEYTNIIEESMENNENPEENIRKTDIDDYKIFKIHTQYRNIRHQVKLSANKHYSL